MFVCRVCLCMRVRVSCMPMYACSCVVYSYVCVFVCCVCLCMRVRVSSMPMYACSRVVYAHVCVFVYARYYMWDSMSLRSSTCIFVWLVLLHIVAPVYACVHLCTPVYAYIRLCTPVCACLCIHERYSHVFALMNIQAGFCVYCLPVCLSVLCVQVYMSVSVNGCECVCELVNCACVYPYV